MDSKKIFKCLAFTWMSSNWTAFYLQVFQLTSLYIDVFKLCSLYFSYSSSEIPATPTADRQELPKTLQHTKTVKKIHLHKQIIKHAGLHYTHNYLWIEGKQVNPLGKGLHCMWVKKIKSSNFHNLTGHLCSLKFDICIRSS